MEARPINGQNFQALPTPMVSNRVGVTLGIAAIALLILGGGALVALGQYHVPPFPQNVVVSIGSISILTGLSAGVYWVCRHVEKSILPPPPPPKEPPKNPLVEAFKAKTQDQDPDKVQKALKGGADPNTRIDGQSALEYAFSSCNYSIMALLLKNGADISTPCSREYHTTLNDYCTKNITGNRAFAHYFKGAALFYQFGDESNKATLLEKIAANPNRIEELIAWADENEYLRVSALLKNEVNT